MMRSALLIVALLVFARSGWSAPAASLCDAAAARAERDWHVPAGVLSAVGTVESGRTDPVHGRTPWPWTINAAGQGRYFATKEDAIAAVLGLMARGYPFIDVGCFQIDIAYHPGVFRSLDDAFDPERNAQAAARILADERLRSPDWGTAVARYHSATPGVGQSYLQQVRLAFPAARLRGLAAEIPEPAEAPAQELIAITVPSGPALPIVIYPGRVNPGRQPQLISMGAYIGRPIVLAPDLPLRRAR